MGRPRGKKHGGRGGGRAPQTRDNGAGEWKVFSPADYKNEAFEAYYKEQNIMTPEEWPEFMSSLKQELPLTFRVTGSRAHAETINDIIKDTYVPNMQNVEFEGKKYNPPTQLAWYPGQLAWQVNAPKRVVRKTEPFKNFQRFLVGETEVGNLSRQEAVSMIPPLFLDVQPHHHCLDMCAAPGSKTAQIIEALNPHHTASTGLLIANDSDYKRTHMLVHQTGRMPSKGLMVTNFDASMFPAIKLEEGKNLQFDRILADVPCSGDGTLRKNIEIWAKWGVADGNSLHSLQLRILERAMNMLKPGGRLVYSTCSLNPSEDESVIAAALLKHTQFSLMNVSSELPELKRRPGMDKWKVATQEGKDGEIHWYETFDEYRKAVDEGKEKEKGEKGKGLPSSLWAPENVENLNLNRCMRLLPHDQDTGGFFVAVLERAGASQTSSLKRQASPVEGEAEIKRAREKSPAPAGSAKAEAAPVAAEGEVKAEKPVTTKKEKRDNSFKEDPYSYVDPSHAEVKAIIEKFQFKDTFPKNNLLVRNEYGDPLRTMYLTNDIVKQIILNNDYTRMRLISAGIKSFTRQDSATSKNSELICKWRPPIDGILELLPHLGDGVLIEGTLSELRTLLEDHYPALEKFKRSEWKEEMEKREMGAAVVKFNAGNSDGGELKLPMYLPIWKAKMSLSLMIDKREKSTLSLRTFGEDICKPPPIQPDQKTASTSTDPTSAEKEAHKMEELVAGDAEGEGKPGVALATEGGEEVA
ncbi:multisite-specific tRNA:(cytosine-C5)-methyltransferase [Cryptococcus neoformans Bt1]|nr:multisite-specific tRNA:(cytosine-C5)-methyltransferase [Cryptococcus neoformans var. grubii Bt1]